MSLSNFANGIHCLPTSSSSPASLRGSSFSPPSIVAYSTRRNMSSSSIRASTEMPPSLPPLSENRVVLGCSAVSVDFLATVASYPNPDDKIRSTARRVQSIRLIMEPAADSSTTKEEQRSPGRLSSPISPLLSLDESSSELTKSMSVIPNPSRLEHPFDLRSLPSFSHASSQSSFPSACSTRTRTSSPKSRASAVVSPSLPPLPESRIILGLGGAGLDFLVTVAAYPKPDEKIRSTSSKVSLLLASLVTERCKSVLKPNTSELTTQVQGGGNAGNALTCASRLGLNPRLISKVANDAQGKGILDELEGDGVDTSYIVVAEEGNSPFTYVIVDSQTKARTCIHTPGYPPMVPSELSQTSLFSALKGARLAYLDGRLHETALVVAQEAARRKIPILIDAERKREGLDDLLSLADYAVCSAKFPQQWTEAPSIPSALVSMLLRLPNIKFVIVTLGEGGCIMLERSINVEGSDLEEMDVDNLLELLKQEIDGNNAIPTCISSKTVMRLSADRIGTLSGRLLVGTAEKIPSSELIDTTGAGDAFVGAILYAICADMPPEKMLTFAAQVAAAGCRGLGARTSLPWRTDPLLAPFLN